MCQDSSGLYSIMSLTSTEDMHFVHQNHVRMRLDLTLIVKSRMRLGQLLVDVGDFHHLLVEIFAYHLLLPISHLIFVDCPSNTLLCANHLNIESLPMLICNN